MKKLILILLLIPLFGLTQNGKLFILLNQYRNANGKASIEWSDKLAKISENHTQEMYKKDSLFHSGLISYECVMKGIHLTPTLDDKMNFIVFLKRNFNIDYENPADYKDDSKVNDYLLYYTIYLWEDEPLHHLIMLRDDVKIGSCNIFIKSNKYKSNKIFFKGKVVEENNTINHYECIWYTTFNLK